MTNHLKNNLLQVGTGCLDLDMHYMFVVCDQLPAQSRAGSVTYRAAMCASSSLLLHADGVRPAAAAAHLEAGCQHPGGGQGDCSRGGAPDTEAPADCAGGGTGTLCGLGKAAGTCQCVTGMLMVQASTQPCANLNSCARLPSATVQHPPLNAVIPGTHQG
jgi:hypothetical protein